MAPKQTTNITSTPTRPNTLADIFGPTTTRAPSERPRLPTPASPRANAGDQLANLARQAAENNTPFPNTAEGHCNYETAFAQWCLKYGSKAEWSTDHLPLTPGSGPLGSGECYDCGKGHPRPNCPTPFTLIPDIEANWRARINGLL